MQDRYDGPRRAIEDAVLRGPGKTDPLLRAALATLGEMPEELRGLAEKIERHAYLVTDEEISALTAKYTDDELFELVVSASLGASTRRLEAGLAALESA